MTNNEKKHDWFIANMSAPNNTLGDFSQEGLTSQNTQILDKNVYKKDERIQEMFKNKEGDFDEKQFSQFYDLTVESFNKFAKDDFDKSVLNDDYFSKYNIYVTDPKAKRLTNSFSINKVKNPYEDVKGILGFTQRTSSDLSIREIAQKQKVFDTTTGKWKNTANDMGFMGSLFTTDTYVLAAYDKDTNEYDEDMGRMVARKKGELKYNSEGKPYYETLAGREVYGKNVLSPWDVLTVDGSTANQWDFMDGDSKDKHIVGSILKNVATVAPHFIPYVGQIYTGMSVASTLSTSLIPALVKMTGGLIANESFEQSEIYKFANNLEGKGKSFSTSVSDYSQENMLTAENIFNMTGDVIKQLAEQRFIAKIPNMIGYSKKEAELMKHLKQTEPDFDLNRVKSLLDQTKDINQKQSILSGIFRNDAVAGDIARKWDMWVGNSGKNLSSLYMTGISSVGAMEAARMANLDQRDTALLFLGTMAGMHKLMQSDIGTWALGDNSMEEIGSFLKKTIQNEVAAIKPVADNTMKALGNKMLGEVTEVVADVAEKQAKKSYMSSLFNAGKGAVDKVGTLLKDGKGMSRSIAAETLEEISEEMIQDGVQGVYNIFNSLGWTSTGNKTEGFDFDFGDMMARYGMAGLGGAIGGAIFHKMSGEIHSILPKDIKHEFVDALMNNYGPELNSKLDEMYEKGLLGSTTLTIEPANLEFNLGGNTNYKPVNPEDQNSISQNEVVYKMLKSHLQFMKDSIFQEEDFSSRKLNDLYNYRHSELLKFKYTTSMQDDLNRIASDIIDVKAAIEKTEGVFNEATEGSKERNTEANAENFKKLDELREELNLIVTGKRYSDYLKQALFISQPEIFKPNLIKDRNDFAFNNYDKKYQDLTEDQKADVDERYENYNKLSKRRQIELALSEYETYMDKLDAKMADISQYAVDRKVISDNITAYKTQLDNIYKLSQNPEMATQFSGSGLATFVTSPFSRDVVEVNKEAKAQMLHYLQNDPYTNKLLNVSIEGYLKNNNTVGTIGKYKIQEDGSITENKIAGVENNADLFDVGMQIVYDKQFDVNGENLYLDEFTTIKDNVPSVDLLKAIKSAGVELKDLSSLNNKNFSEDSKIKAALLENQAEINKQIDLIATEMSQNQNNYHDEFIDLDDSIKRDIANNISDYYKSYLNAIIGSLSGNKIMIGVDGELNVVSRLTDQLEDQDVLADYLDTLNFADNFYNTLKDGKKTNPMFELAKEIVGERSGKVIDLLDILSNEYGNLGNKNTAEEYVIENPLNAQEMELIINSLNKAKAVLFGAVDFSTDYDDGRITGYNSAVNAAIAKGSFDGSVEQKPRSIIDQETGVSLGNEFQAMIDKTNLVLNLNNFNLSGSIRETRRTSSRFMTLLIESIMNPEGENFKSLVASGVNLDKLDLLRSELKTYNSMIDIIQSSRDGVEQSLIPSDETTMSNLRRDLNLVEQTIYEIVNIDNDPKDIIPKIIKKYKKEAIKSLDDFSNTILNLSTVQQQMFLTKAMSVDPVQFYNDYVGDLSKPTNKLTDSNFAPFFGQELAVSYGYWAMMSNKKDVDTYKLFTEQVLPNHNLPKEKYEDGFENNEFRASLYNAITIFGIPGAGKSTAVIESLYKIAESYGYNVAGYAPYDTQLSNLNKLNIINQKRTVKDLFTSVFGSDITEEIYNTLNDYSVAESENTNSIIDRRLNDIGGDTARYAYNVNLNHSGVKKLLNSNKTIMIDGKIPNVIIVDEITQVPGPAVHLLDLMVTIHNKNNPNNTITVIQTGDVEQNGSSTSMKIPNAKPVTEQTNISNFNYISTPVLSQSMRSNYNLLNNNINKLRSLNREVRAYQELKIDNFASLKSLVESQVMFDYKVENNRMVGYQIVDTLTPQSIAQVYNYVNKDGAEADVAIITDRNDIEGLKNELLAEGVEESRIKIFNPKQVQGLEFDYTVVDVANTILTENDYKDDTVYGKIYNNLRNLYTLASRSKVGTLIAKKATNGFTVSSETGEILVQTVSLDDGEREAYKAFTIDSISKSIANLKTFNTNIVNAEKINIEPEPIVTGNTTLAEKEDITNLVNKMLDGQVLPEEGADGKEVNIREDETRPMIYSYHVRNGYTVDKDGGINVESFQDMTDQALQFHTQSYNTDVPLIYALLNDEDIDTEYLDDAGNKSELLKEAETVHFELKDSIIQYLTVFKGRATMKGLRAFLNTKSNLSPATIDLLNSSMTDIENYKLAIVTKTFDPKYDNDNSVVNGVSKAKKKGNYISYLALVDTTKSNDEYNVYDKVITLAALANRENANTKQIKGVQNTYDIIEALHEQYLEQNNPSEDSEETLATYSRSFYFSNDNAITELTPISNIGMRTNDANEYQSFEDLKKNNPGFHFTDTFFLTEDIISKFDEEAVNANLKAFDKPLSSANTAVLDLVGTKATFVTKDPNIRTIEQAMQRLREEIALAKQSPDGYPGTVRLLPLNAQGRKFSELMTYTNDLMKRVATNKNAAGITELRSATNEYAAAKILARLTILYHSYMERGYVPSYLNNIDNFDQDVFYPQLGSTLDMMYRFMTGSDLINFYKHKNVGDTSSDPIKFYLNSKSSEINTNFPYYKKHVESLNPNSNEKFIIGSTASLAREFVLAKDLLDIIKNPDFNVNLELQVASEYVLKESEANRVGIKGLKGMSSMLRAMITGGNYTMDGVSHKISADLTYGKLEPFMEALDMIITGGEGNNMPLFPDGIWVETFRDSSGPSHASGDQVSFYKIATGDKFLQTKVVLTNPRFLFDISKFNVPDIEVQERIINEKSKQFDELLNKINTAPIWADYFNNVERPEINILLDNLGLKPKYNDIIKTFVSTNKNTIITDPRPLDVAISETLMKDNSYTEQLYTALDKAIEEFWEEFPGTFFNEGKLITQGISFDFKKEETSKYLDFETINNVIYFKDSLVGIEDIDGNVQVYSPQYEGVVLVREEFKDSQVSNEVIALREAIHNKVNDLYKIPELLTEDVRSIVRSLDIENIINISELKTIYDSLEKGINNEVNDLRLSIVNTVMKSSTELDLSDVNIQGSGGYQTLISQMNTPIGTSLGLETLDFEIVKNSNIIGTFVLDLTEKGINIMSYTNNLTGENVTITDKTVRQIEFEKQTAEANKVALEEENKSLDEERKSKEEELKETIKSANTVLESVIAQSELDNLNQAVNELTKMNDVAIKEQDDSIKQNDQTLKVQEKLKSEIDNGNIAKEVKDRQEKVIEDQVKEVKKRQTKREKLMENLKKLNNDVVNHFISNVTIAEELMKDENGQIELSKSYLYAKYELMKLEGDNSAISKEMTDIYKQLTTKKC